MNISNLFVGINDEKVCCQDHPLLQAFFRSTLSNEPTLKPRDGSLFFPTGLQTRSLSVNIHPELSLPTACAVGFFARKTKKPPQGRLLFISQRLLICRSFQAKVYVGSLSCDPPSGCTLQIALLDQIRFQHVFYGVLLLTDGGGQVVEPDWPPINLSMTANNSLRSMKSKPSLSTSSMSMARAAMGPSIRPSRLHLGKISYPP